MSAKKKRRSGRPKNRPAGTKKRQAANRPKARPSGGSSVIPADAEASEARPSSDAAAQAESGQEAKAADTEPSEVSQPVDTKADSDERPTADAEHEESEPAAEDQPDAEPEPEPDVAAEDPVADDDQPESSPEPDGENPAEPAADAASEPQAPSEPAAEAAPEPEADAPAPDQPAEAERSTTDAADVHTDPAALTDLTDAAAEETPTAKPDGAASGYQPHQTLSFRVELRRQLRRRRTQLVLALVAVLPFVLVGAFAIGTANPNRRTGGFIDLATVSAPNFVVVALLISAGFLLPTTVALFFGDTVASEASWSSLKYLLAAPVPRGRLLRQKALVAGALSATALAVLPVVGLVVGVIFYGAVDAISPTGDAASFSSSIVSLIMTWAYIVLQLTWIAALAFLLSVSTDAPLGAVGGAVLAAIVSLMLDQITALGSLRQVLPTHGALAWTDLLSSDVDWNPLATGIFTSLVYALVFALLAVRRFAVKDITS